MGVAKVFRIELTGGKLVEKDIIAIKKAMTEMAAAIKKAKGELSALLSGGGDASAISTVNKKIAELENRLKSLSQQRKSAEVDAKRAAEAEKLLAQAKLNVAKADQARIASQIAQEKELDRQIALENKQTDALRRQKQAAEALPGSYNAIKASLAALRPFIQSGGIGGTVAFNGKQINFDQAIAEFKQLSAAEQDFRRQFSKDGLLVGEYTTGIVQAFNKLDIDDIIKRQVTGAKQQLGQLETKTKELVVAYRAAQQSGTVDLNKLEKEIHDNVVETQKLKAAVGQAETQLKGMGGVGSQITSSISKNFKDLKNSVAQFALGFVGFQAVVGGVGKVFGDTVKLDSLDAALRVVSGTEQELAINNEFLTRTIERLGLETITTSVAFKNFYAASTQAGISADQTREIFAAATAATSNLKLSQEDTNGVLLAFSQIASKGKVQAEELRGQIGERVPGAFAIAARAIGVTQAELNKMLEKGEVIASDFLPKFAAELQKTFGGDTTKNITGLQASVNRLKNEFTSLLKDNQGGLSGFFTAIVEGARLLIKFLPQLIILSTLLGLSWLVANAHLIAYRASIFAYNLLILRNYALLLILKAGQLAYNSILIVSRGVLIAATKAAQLFNITVKAGTGPLGIILTIIGLLATAFTAFGGILSRTSEELKGNTLQLKIARDVHQQAARAIAEQKATLMGYAAVVKDTSISEGTRLKALQDLIKINPAFSAALKGNTIDMDAFNTILKEVNDNLLRKAELEAAQVLQQKEFQRLVELQSLKQSLEIAKAQKTGFGDLTDEQRDAFSQKTSVGRTAFTSDLFNTKISDADFKEAFKSLDGQIQRQGKVLDATVGVLKDKYKNVNDTITAGNKTIAENPVEINIEKLKADIKLLDDQIEVFKGSQKDLTKLIAERKRLQDLLDKALGVDKSKPARSSKLTGEQKDLFKDIDAIRDRMLAEQGKLFADLAIDEKTYLVNILKINTDAIDKKLAIIKGKNAEERKIIAQLNLEKVNQQKETSKKLFEIDNKQLEIDQRNKETAARQKLQATELDPNLSNEGRLKAQEEFFNTLLQDQIVFNQQQIALEKKYGIASIENEQARKEAIEKLNEELKNILLATPEAQIRDIRASGEKQLNEYRAYFSRLRKAILDNDKLTKTQRKRQLEALDRAETLTILSSELAQLTIEFKKIEKLYKEGLKSEQEFLDAKAKMEQKAAEQAAEIPKQLDQIDFTSFRGAIDSVGLFDKEIGDSGISFGKVISDAFDIATQALQNYFAAKEAAIERDKQLHIEALERERERVLATSQSQAEQDTINRQYDKKKRKLEQEAGERLKKLKKTEARLALLTELANIWSSVWQLGPIGGAIAGAILSAFAYARFAVRAQEINSMQFAGGGKVPKLKTGKIVTPSNIPMQKNGDNIYATVKRGEVILNEKQQKAIGGPSVFKRIGVPGFATGGVTAPQLGTSLKPPTFNSGFYSAGVNAAMQGDERMQRLENLVADVATMVYATDMKEVTLNPGKVTKAQERTKKDVSVGTI